MCPLLARIHTRTHVPVEVGCVVSERVGVPPVGEAERHEEGGRPVEDAPGGAVAVLGPHGVALLHVPLLLPAAAAQSGKEKRRSSPLA